MSAADAAGAPGVVTAADGEELYRRHGNWLVAFLRRRFSAQEAEDLAQETYVRTVGARTEIHNPRAFLAKVALRTARDLSVRKANRLVYVPQDAADGATESEQDQVLLMKQLVLALPADLQVVFVLSRFAGLTNEEIAARCRLSVKRVEARMTQARAKLAALLRE